MTGSTATVTRTPALAALVERVDTAVRTSDSAGATVAAVEAALGPALGDPDLLGPAQTEPDADCYRQHLLHVAPDGAFSVVALVWLPGQQTPVHDHLTWCVVGVHRGAEYEIRYRFGHDGESLEETTRARAEVGTVQGLLPPGDIHRVRNDGDDLAVSLHVYGADIGRLGSSVRRLYELPAG